MNTRVSHLRNRRAVSEIFGALMLIIVVVVAVGTIAVFISQTQQQAMERQNFQDSVKAEKFEITSVQFFPNDTKSDFEIDDNTGTRHLLEYISETQVSLGEDGTICNLAPAGATYSQAIKLGHFATIALGPPCTITLETGTSVINQARILNATFDVRNSNIQDSYICATSLNDEYSLGFDDLSGTHHASGSPMKLPAQESDKVILTYDQYNRAPERLATLKATVYSCAANYFDASYKVSTPVVLTQYATEDIGTNTKRIVPVFQPTTTDGLVRWRIDVPTNLNTLNDWSSDQIVTKYVDGSVLTYRPESLFSSAEQNSLKITGPLHISMKSVSNGLLATSPIIVVPETDSILPPVGLASTSITTTLPNSLVTVQLTDPLGRGVPNSAVTSVVSGTIPTSEVATDMTPYTLTDSTGSATIHVSWDASATSGDVAYLSVSSNGITRQIQITVP